jgi:hypothetical protein
MDITHSSWKITKLHYAKVYDERDHRREGADGRRPGRRARIETQRVPSERVGHGQNVSD